MWLGQAHLRSVSRFACMCNLHALTNCAPKLWEPLVYVLLWKISCDRSCNSGTFSDDALALLPRETRPFLSLRPNPCSILPCCVKGERAGNLNRKLIWGKTKWGVGWFWTPGSFASDTCAYTCPKTVLASGSSEICPLQGAMQPYPPGNDQRQRIKQHHGPISHRKETPVWLATVTQLFHG